MVDEHPLAGHVALVHRTDLRHGLVRLVDDEQEVVREVVDQAVRRGPRRPAVDVSRVVLDAAARPDLAHHLDVVGGAHPQPLRLEQLALALQLGQPVGQLDLDAPDRPLHALRSGDVVGGREDVHLGLLADHLTGDRVERVDPLDLVAEQLDPDRELLVDRDDLDGVAAHPERAAGEGQVVAGVLHLDELQQQLVAVHLLADPEPDHPVDVLLRRAQAVDARHRRDHDDVAPGQQRAGRAVPEPLDLVVDRRVLLDVGVRLRDVGLGLVVVVVGHEVLDRVVGQQLAELVGQLGGQGLVRRHDEGRSLDLLDDPGGRRGLAGAGRAEQHDVVLAGLDPPGDLVDRRRLVTARRELGDHLERGHRPLDVGRRTHTSTVRPGSDTSPPEARLGLDCQSSASAGVPPAAKRLDCQSSGLEGRIRDRETTRGPPPGWVTGPVQGAWGCYDALVMSHASRYARLLPSSTHFASRLDASFSAAAASCCPARPAYMRR